MCLQLADLSLCHPEGILDDVCLGVGRSYVTTDFVVVEIGGSENTPIILGCPFPVTTKAIIYTDTAKIIFSINERKERFNCKNKILEALAHPRYPYLKNTSQLSRKREEIEGGIRRIINLNHI
jgi:hypothetical protein